MSYFSSKTTNDVQNISTRESRIDISTYSKRADLVEREQSI